MKTPAAFSFLASLVLVLTGCAQLDVSQGDPNRVIKGTVNVPTGIPAGAEVLVRILETAPAVRPAGANRDLPLPDRPAAPQPVERVLAEFRQTVATATMDPLPFSIDLVASDAQLRHGLTIEARVSSGGRVRFRTLAGHVVTLGSAPHPHELTLEPVN